MSRWVSRVSDSGRGSDMSLLNGSAVDCQTDNLREHQSVMRNAAAIWRTTRSVVVLLSLAAWFVLSNHCAIGMVASLADAAPETSGCPMHSMPAKEKQAPKPPCCKDLRAVVSKCLKSASITVRLVGSHTYAPEILARPPRETTEIDGLDTGPPGPVSFAELVLQESMLAHAPPVS